jgi:hypothetical protein
VAAGAGPEHEEATVRVHDPQPCVNNRLAAVLRKLEDCRPSGPRCYLATCPVCRGPAALRVELCSDGTILPKCTAGCGIAAVLRQLGVTPADLFAKVGRRDGATGPKAVRR